MGETRIRDERAQYLVVLQAKLEDLLGEIVLTRTNIDISQKQPCTLVDCLFVCLFVCIYCIIPLDLRHQWRSKRPCSFA